MRLVVCALFDKQAEQFSRPIIDVTVGLIMRGLTDEVFGPRGGPDNPMRLHPEDFVLYQVGWYETEDGVLTEEKKLLIPVDQLRTTERTEPDASGNGRPRDVPLLPLGTKVN